MEQTTALYSSLELNKIRVYLISRKNLIKREKNASSATCTNFFLISIEMKGCDAWPRSRKRGASNKVNQKKKNFTRRECFSFLNRFVVLLGLRIVVSKGNWGQNICAFSFSIRAVFSLHGDWWIMKFHLSTYEAEYKF